MLADLMFEVLLLPLDLNEGQPYLRLGDKDEGGFLTSEEHICISKAKSSKTYDNKTWGRIVCAPRRIRRKGVAGPAGLRAFLLLELVSKFPRVQRALIFI